MVFGPTEFLCENDPTSMFYLASDFENQLPNDGDRHSPCCIYALIGKIRDTLKVSLLVALLAGPNDVWAYQVSLQKNDITLMFHLARDFDNQLPNGNQLPNPGD